MINSNILNQGLGTSHGKVILIGEHSVVYGYPAIGIPVTGLTLTTSIYNNAFNKIILDFFNIHPDVILS